LLEWEGDVARALQIPGDGGLQRAVLQHRQHHDAIHAGVAADWPATEVSLATSPSIIGIPVSQALPIAPSPLAIGFDA
jgi:hypothetical protein